MRRKSTRGRRLRAILAAWPNLRRPIDAQAAEYGKVMGIEAFERQYSRKPSHWPSAYASVGYYAIKRALDRHFAARPA